MYFFFGNSEAFCKKIMSYCFILRHESVAIKIFCHALKIKISVDPQKKFGISNLLCMNLFPADQVKKYADSRFFFSNRQTLSIHCGVVENHFFDLLVQLSFLHVVYFSALC